MATSKPRGYGTVLKEGNGFRAYGYVLDDEGKKKPTKKRFNTEKEGWDWLEGLNRRSKALSIEDGEQAPETVRDLLMAWLKKKERQRKFEGKPDEKTWEEYRAIIAAWHAPALGKEKLDSRGLRKKLIQHQNALAKAVSSKTHKPLSVSRQRNIWVPLRSAFRYGAQEGWISPNPMESIEKFVVESESPREKVMPKADADKLRDWLEAQGCNHKAGVCRLRWELAFESGRRQGEILGLGWNEVYLTDVADESFMEVKAKAKARPWKHGCGRDAQGQWKCEREARYCPKKKDGGLRIEPGTKGGVSVRPKIPLDSEMVDMFAEHKRAQDRERASAVEHRTKDLLDPSHEGLVFTQPITQRPYGPRHDAEIFERLIKRAGIDTLYHIHQLRHTAATDLADATGGDLPVIADILGHKSITTTLGYISPDMDARRKALAAAKAVRAKRQKPVEKDTAE
ncbi:tyrosine-type recombinase/integrase [Citricoccus nitrophenolicus]|uniref:tyrosine-type recombinase/integrase n=1 Tax=Citricoccus nitrophenolicus TaxID=863575 RepID=UPI0031EBA473